MSKKATLRFVGDIMLGGSVLPKIHEFGPTYPFEKFIGTTEPADIFFGNLECSLCDVGSPPRLNKILLHSTPAATSGLLESGVNIVSLANNHAFDYGHASLKSAQEHLKAAGIHCVGAGDNISSATKPVVLERNGLHFAFLAYCASEAYCEEFADESGPGVARLDPDAIRKNIETAKQCSDFVIVSLHNGIEFSDYPTTDNVRVARQIIDDGATVVVGSHAHVTQGYELYKNGLILYDLGSFVFGDIIISSPFVYRYHLTMEKAKQGMMVDCVFAEEGIIDHEFIPIHISSSFQASLLDGEEQKAAVRRFNRQSRMIVTNGYLVYQQLHRFKNGTLSFLRSWPFLRKLEALVRRKK